MRDRSLAGRSWFLFLLAASAVPEVAVMGSAALAAQPTALAAQTTTIDAHASYPEGPLWRRGSLLYVEYAANDIKVWNGKSTSTLWRKADCGPSALIDFGPGHLLVACYDSNSIVEIDPNGREIRTLAADRTGKGFNGPNDFTPDGSGGVYFSASGKYDVAAPITGAVLHLSAQDGRIAELATTIHYPNGLTLDRDGKNLLVAEMLAGRILEFPLEPDGSLGPRRVWARLQDLAAPTPGADAYNGPDGFKRGPDGNYYIAQNGSGRVLVVDDRKKLIREIRVETPFVTNLAFGPAGANSIFITGAFDQWKEPYAGAVYRWAP